MNYELSNAHDLRLKAKYCDRYCYFDGGNNTTTTQSTSQPSSLAQPYLNDLMSQAKGLYNQGSSYAPFNTVAPFSPATLQGLQMTQDRAQNGSPVMNAANNSLTNLLQAQTSPGSDYLSSMLGNYQQPGQNAATGNAQTLANGGGPGSSTMAQWADSSNINPYLNAQFQAASKPVIDSVNAQFSQAGRTGSVANQDALATRLGDLSSNIFANGYDNAANRSLNAAGQQQNNALQGANLLGSLSQNDTSNRLQSNTLQANIANLLNSNQIARGNQQIAGATVAPSLANQDWTNIQNQLQAGNAYDTQAQNYINDALSRWNYSQDQPWTLLQRYAGGTAGLPGLGQTTSGTTTQPTQSALPAALGAGVNLLSSQGSNGASLFSNLLGY